MIQPASGKDRLIVMSRYPTPGGAKTRLIPLLGPVGAARLHRQLVHMTLDTARHIVGTQRAAVRVQSTGASTMAMAQMFGADLTYHDQGSGDLGDRLYRACVDVFTDGADRAVVIGTDCPTLEAKRIQEAFAALTDHDVVLGPAMDGGYYLIGLRQPHRALFADISWGGPGVYGQTVQRAQQLGLRVRTLARMSDVDTPADLYTWAQSRCASGSETPWLSVIIPTLNEQDHVAATLASVLVGRGMEVIIVDGGSHDQTVPISQQFGVITLSARPPRSNQLNTAAAIARSQALLFLHADTLLPSDYPSAIPALLGRPGTAGGAFALRIDHPGVGLRLIEAVANLRSRYLGLPYGDQAVFLSRTLFNGLEGFTGLPVMEDYAFAKRLRQHGRVRLADSCVRTSPRRWINHGLVRTTLTHQAMMLAYLLGVSPDRVARWRPDRTKQIINQSPTGVGPSNTTARPATNR